MANVLVAKQMARVHRLKKWRKVKGWVIFSLSVMLMAAMAVKYYYG